MILKKIKKEGLANQPFIITPLPLKDELLSSWLVRTAYAHHLHPHTFFQNYLGLHHGVCTANNLDALLNYEQIQCIQSKCQNNIDIYTLTLNSYEGYLQENVINNGLNKLICNYRFCPKCLKEDDIPYFRKYWRVYFYTACHKHQCFLYDTCPKCNTKIDISKMFKNKSSYKYCFKCNFDLSKSRVKSVQPEFTYGLKTITILKKTLKNGYIQFPQNNVVYSFVFFDTILQLCKVILKHKNYKWLENHSLFQILTSKDYKPFTPIHIQLSIKEQFSLFALSMYLFDKYPLNMKKFIYENKLTHYKMLKDMNYVSFWYDSLINTLSPRYVPYSKIITDQEIQNAKRHLIRNHKPLNKKNMSEILGCNFFSKYNNLYF